MFWKKKTAEIVEKSAEDPVCGMAVNQEHAYHTEIGGRTYYFCRPSCKAAFKKEVNKKLRSMRPQVRKKSVKDGGSCH